MKKFLSIGLLTLCALAVTERQADAWINSKFSIGLNWHLQSANNNWLWGFWKNGQVPGPEAFGPGGAAPYPHGVGPGPQMTPAGSFPYFGGYPQTAAPGTVAGYPAPNAQDWQLYQAMQHGYNPYQTVSYQPNAMYYPNYYNPNYYAPSYMVNYGAQAQVPYYWYSGR
jgi:hypothetical protein